MKLKSVDLKDKEMEKEIKRFLDFTGYDYWEKIIDKIDTVEGRFYKELYLLKRNPFIRSLKQYFQLIKEGKSIWKHTSEDLINLARNVFIINRVSYNLNDNGKNLIRGRLRNENGIRPFLFELEIATHFFRRGLDVEFLEYEASNTSGKTFEFLVSGDGIEREIECKWKSIDAGRKITRSGFYILCDEISKRVVPNIKGKRCLVELICNKNLGTDQKTFIKISNDILQSINDGKTELISDEHFRIKIDYLQDDLIIKSDEQFVSAITPYYSEKSHFVVISNSDATVIVKVESEEKDKVLDSIYEELKGATRKFTGKRPALIACYIAGIESHQWKELRGENGLSRMTTYLLSKENTNHIHTIGYSSEPDPIIIERIKDFKSEGLFFSNLNCLYNKGEDIFFVKRQS